MIDYRLIVTQKTKIVGHWVNETIILLSTTDYMSVLSVQIPLCINPSARHMPCEEKLRFKNDNFIIVLSSTNRWIQITFDLEILTVVKHQNRTLKESKYSLDKVWNRNNCINSPLIDLICFDLQGRTTGKAPNKDQNTDLNNKLFHTYKAVF